MEKKQALAFVRSALEINFPGRRFNDREVRESAAVVLPFAELANNPTKYASDPSKLTPELVLFVGCQQDTENSAALFQALKQIGGK